MMSSMRLLLWTAFLGFSVFAVSPIHAAYAAEDTVDILAPAQTDYIEEEDLLDTYEGGPAVHGLQLILRMADSTFVEGTPIEFTVTFRNTTVASLGLVSYRLRKAGTETSASSPTPSSQVLRRAATIVEANGRKPLAKTRDLSWVGYRRGPSPPTRFVTYIPPGKTVQETGDIAQEYRYRSFNPGLAPGEYTLTVTYSNDIVLGNTWRGTARSNTVAFTVTAAE